MKVRVAVLGRASGVRGEVRVALHTDDPKTRFAPGAVLLTDRPDLPRLTVKQARRSGKHFVASFAEVPDRDTAETLSGVKLLVETDAPEADETPRSANSVHSGSNLEALVLADSTDSGLADADPDGEDGFYRHELVGLSAMTEIGAELGTVSDLIIGVAQDLLEVTTPAGQKVLVPFVFKIVPEVDLTAGRVVMRPPGGLFPNQAEDDKAGSQTAPHEQKKGT